MSNVLELTPLIPVAESDIPALARFYNAGIAEIKADPNRYTEWKPFATNQIEEIVAHPSREALVIHEMTTGVIVGAVIVDDFDRAAWGREAEVFDMNSGIWKPNEFEVPETFIHFSKFLAGRKGLGRGALWTGLVEYATQLQAEALIAEAFDFRAKGAPADSLRNFYEGTVNMEWKGRVRYPSGYYGDIIGEEIPVNRYIRMISQEY